MLKVLLLSLQAACESLEQFCPCRSPSRKSVNLVWPNGIVVYLEALLLYVILISLFEHSTSKRYPAFANRSMKCGIFRGSTGLFIFFTSIIGNNSVGFGRIKAIGESGAKVKIRKRPAFCGKDKAYSLFVRNCSIIFITSFLLANSWKLLLFS